MRFVNKVLKRYSIKKVIVEFFILLIGYPLYLFSFLFPRNKDKWVFGNKNSFSGNGKYLYLYLLNNTDRKVFWITSNKNLLKEMRTQKLPVYYKYNIVGLYHLLTSYYYVYTVSSNYINFWTSGRACKINLWHGIGLKSLDTKSSGLRDKSFISKLLMPYGYENCRLFLSTSDFQNKHFANCLSLDKHTIYDGMYPRCSFLLKDKEEIWEHIEKYESEDLFSLVHLTSYYKHIYIYMPTWRLYLGGDFLNYALPDMYELNEVLKNSNSLLLMKLHPAIKYNPVSFEQFSHIRNIDPEMDIYPILPFTDILITDYSSIFYDYILMPQKGCIFYDFDYDSYIKRESNFILDFHEYTPGIHVNKFDDLLLLITEENECPIRDREKLLSFFWGNYQHKDMKSLYETICEL